MKTLKQIISEECGCGAATPGSTMGAGNPMAPSNFGSDPTTPGSGDLFTAKAKREKRRKRQTNEGLLDADFDIQDDTVATAVCEGWAEKLCQLNARNDVQGYLKYCKEMEDEVSAASISTNKSIMALMRSKDYTFITFKPKLKVPGYGAYDNAIEIRKFVKNPLPEVVELFTMGDSDVGIRYRKKVNHPTVLDLKNNRTYALNADVFEAMCEVFKKYGLSIY